MFLFIRDDVVVNKGGDEFIGKGDGFDFLLQLNLVFFLRKNLVILSILLLYFSFFNVFMGFLGKEESENYDLIVEFKKIYMGKQEFKDFFKQNMIQEMLDDFREVCYRDIVNL